MARKTSKIVGRQKLERFFGFRLSYNADVTAHELQRMQPDIQRACQAITSIKGFTNEEYVAFIHSFQLTRVREKHFGFATLEKRLASLDITLQIPQKQRRRRSMGFFNHLCDLDDPLRQRGVLVESSQYEIRHSIPTEQLLAQHLTHRWHVITFVQRAVREEHRKVIARAQPCATPQFASVLNAEFGQPTQLCCYMRKLQLILPNIESAPTTPPPAPPSRFESTTRLLKRVVNQRQLKRLVHAMPDGEALRHSLPHVSSSAEQYIDGVVELLEQHGKMHEMLELLAEKRPVLRDDILAVAAQWQMRKAG